MNQFSILKVDCPNVFVAKDLLLFEKVVGICNQIKKGISKALPCSEIIVGNIYLATVSSELVRVRVLSLEQTTEFRCLLIDHGIIEQIKRQRIYSLPPNQLDFEPAVKMIKISGMKPSGMKAVQTGANIFMEKGEIEKWIPASYKFVCRIFEEYNVVYVECLKQISIDKIYANVSVMYENQRKNLKELLITEGFAVSSDEGIITSDISTSQTISQDKSDTESVSSCDSLAMESVSKIIEHTRENVKNLVISEKRIDTPKIKIDRCNNVNNSVVHGSLDELSLEILHQKVKCWSVTKSTKIDSNEKVAVEYQYESPIKPITSYKNDPIISPFLKEAMASHNTKSLLLIQAFMLPTIVRGVNIVAIAPPKKGKSMGMLMPILQSIATKRISATRSCNPLAIILCSSWKKVQNLSNSAHTFLKFITKTQKLSKPRLVSAYAGSTEKKGIHPILEGCDILIITPKCLLQWLQQYEFIKLNELEIFCLDDAENIIAEHLETLKAIMVHKRTGSIDSCNEPSQFITASRWTSGLESYVKHEMGNRFSIAVNDPLEVAVIERIKQQIVEYDGEFYQKLLAYLEITESSLKRTIIFASEDSLITSVYFYLGSRVSVDLKLMVGSMSSEELKSISREWNQYRGYVNMPILLISDEALKCSDISIFNAQNLLHVDINESTFGGRLNFMRDNYPQLPFLTPSDAKSANDKNLNMNSFIFLSPKTIDLTTANFLYKFLGRCNSPRPDWLQGKAIDFILMRERSKECNEICPRIKSYGECKLPGCEKRHMVLSVIDKPLLPNRGHIKFRLLHLVSPSHFFVRIIEFNTTSDCEVSSRTKYLSLKMKMANYFNNSKNIHGVDFKFIQVGFIAALKIKNKFYERVTVTKKNSGRVWLKLIDQGSDMIAEQADLLQLPNELVDIPPQAIEAYVTGLKPVDNDEYYNENSCKFAENLLEGHDYYAIIVLCIGSNLWIDAVTQRKHYNATNLTVFDNNLSGALVLEELADKNPQHVEKLARLCTGKIDIWKPKSSDEKLEKPVPIMRKFSYIDLPIVFESLPSAEDDIQVNTECVLSSIESPNFIILNNRDSVQSAVDIQIQIESLIDSIEILDGKKVKIGARILYFKDGSWQRGYIIKISPCIEVFSLDWGTIEKFECQECQFKKLPREYQELPYQAILCSLYYCSHADNSYSSDVNSFIEQFASNHKNKVSLVVSNVSKEEVNSSTFLDDMNGYELTDTDLFHSLHRHQVIISKKASHLSEETLHEVLIRNQNILPSMPWIYEVIPECQLFISRMLRNGSIPHLVSDLLRTKDGEKRVKISETIERIISRKCQDYLSSNCVSNNISDILNALCIMIHFVNEQSIFMCIYRSLNKLLDLAYNKRIPVQVDNENEEFSVNFIALIILPYDSISFHMLRHLNVSARNNQTDNCRIMVDNFRMLILDSHTATCLLRENTWYVVIANCVAALQNDENTFNMLMEVVIQLAMLWKKDDPVLAGILEQCCLSFSTSESPSVWNSSLSLVSCLVNNQQYSRFLRELNFFEILFDKFLQYYREIDQWHEFHDLCLDVLANMWRNGSADQKSILKKRRLSKDIDYMRNKNVENLNLGHFVNDIIREESSLRTTGTREKDYNCNKPTNDKKAGFPSDADALDWLQGNEMIAKKFHKSYKRVFKDGHAESSSDDDGNNSNFSDSDSSDAEVVPFLSSGNPADEDNVDCFEKA